MAIFPGVGVAPAAAFQGSEADGDSARQAVSYETGTILEAGRCTQLDGAGRLIVGTGARLVGWTILDTTKIQPSPANTMITVMRKGRIYAALAAGSTAPAHGAVVNVDATGAIANVGTAVPGVVGYSYGSARTVGAPAGTCLIEINLP